MGERWSAIASGAEREPGAITASRTPASASAAVKRSAHRRFSDPVSTADGVDACESLGDGRSTPRIVDRLPHDRELDLGLGPLGGGIGAGHDARAREEKR